MAWYRCVGGAGGSLKLRTASGPITTFETNIETAFVSLKSDINPVQSGTGTPSPQNVRPISGFSALNVTRTGVNLWDEQTRNGYYKVDGTFQSYSGNLATVNPIKVKPNTNYRLLVSGGTGAIGRVCWYDANGTFISTQVPQYANIVLTSPANAHYLNFDLTGAYGTTYGNNVAVLYPSTQTTYEPYNGQTATVNFGQTVYGGIVDVTRGKVTLTHGYHQLTGTEDWAWAKSSSYSGGFNTPVTSVGAKVATPFICTHAKTALSVSEYEWGTCYCDSALNIRIMQASDTVQDWKNYLASQYSNGTPVSICYELATPIEITTTPENLTAIVGQNNVYSDTNGDTEVKYLYRE